MIDRYKDEETIFNAAIQLKSRDERDAYLAEACGGDKKLRADVEALLQAHEAKSLLDEPIFDPNVTFDESPLTEGPGTVIGNYKLLEQIGEGGMAVVYMAEQEKPLRRRVALKIIKLGMDTKSVIARFEAERQALAVMDHPNIAKVFDAGATETGRPYFVMELVKGVSITEYCDKNKLNTRERLHLFMQVCNAVQHAHQKGIIHRDIKPSNIMVTLHDGQPVPKVIDFGIAKATSRTLTEKTLFTRYAQMIGTPAYMSPEQAEFSELDIDTRTDIYSLGVLLYELLTAATPFSEEELRKAGYLEMQRIIREEEPVKPSTRLSTLGELLTDIAEHRRTNPDLLAKLVSGDLDWVVMKALEKDRTRRYETANEFAADIGRHLGDEPVSAGPPSAGYRLRKFVRRNRAPVTAAGAVTAALVVGFVVSTVMYFQAEHQAKISKAVILFLINDVINDVLAQVDLDVLNATSKKVKGKFEDEPIIEVWILEALGEKCMALGEYEAAKAHLERACQIRAELFGEEHPDTLRLKNALITIRFFCEDGGDPHSILQMLRFLKQNEQFSSSEVGRMLIEGEEALDIKRRVLGEEHPDTLESINDLAVLYKDQARHDEAEPLLLEAIEGRKQKLGEDHPETLESMKNLIELYEAWGKPEKAEEWRAKLPRKKGKEE